MDLAYVTIIVLASMIFVLSGMVGYLYWQQTRLQQSIHSLGIVVSTLANPPELEAEPEPEPVPVPEPVAQPQAVAVEEEEEEDDRVSVEHVSEAPPKEAANVDIDDLQSKTASQLREILTQKGIPFGKRDSKSVLIELLKATA
jgi:hypothetical protein